MDRPLVAANVMRSFSLASTLLQSLKNLVRSKPGNLLKALTQLVARHLAAPSRPAETSDWTVVSRKKPPKPRQVELRPPEPLPASGRNVERKRKSSSSCSACWHKRKRKGKTIYSCERSCAAWKRLVTPAPVNASWHLAFKCVHTVTNVAKLENACAKSETVLFAPKNVTELDEGCAFLLGQPAAKVSVAFLEDDPDWKSAVETWFPKCVFQNLRPS